MTFQSSGVVRTTLVVLTQFFSCLCFRPDSAIAAVAKSGRYKEALSMMDQMKKDGLKADVYTFSAAISACGKSGQWEKAIELLNIMPDDGELHQGTVAASM